MVNCSLCSLCNKPVKVNQKGLKCTQCKKWVHTKCSDVSEKLYNDPTEFFLNWECRKCMMKHMPFYGEQYSICDITSKSSKECIRPSKSRINQKDLKITHLNEKGLNCAHLNVVSLIKNFDEIKSILCNNNIHIFALNECRLDDSIRDSELKVEHYKLIRKDRNRQGGGIAIYIHESLSYKLLSNPSFNKLEAILLLIDIKKSKPLLFANWYRPPNSNNEVLSLYENMLTFIEGFDASVLLMGDINLNIAQKPLSSDCKRYCQLNDIHDLQHINQSECTRVTPETRTLIDHMLCNRLENVNSWGIHEVGFSDHSLSCLSLKVHQVNDTNNYAKVISFRKSKGVDIGAFKDEMRSQDWSTVENSCTLDEAVATWENIVMKVVDKYMPIKMKKVRKKDSPWINQSIFDLMKKRDKIKKRAVIHNKAEDWKDYRKMRNKVTIEIKRAKKSYYAEKIRDSQGRSKSWEILKLLMPQKSSDPMQDTGDNETLANKFNNHFANVAKSLAPKDDRIKNTPITSGNKCNDKSFKLSLVSEADVLKEICALKNKKSVGVDGISPYILKLCSFELVKCLTFIVNRSISEGCVPQRWKIAKIIPIFKKGDKSNPDHYRPISLLPCVSKVLERVIQRQLIQFLIDNDILSKHQSGFRARHSTTTTLIKVTDDWLMSLDQGMYIGTVFVDLQKAFDLVDLDILLEKLTTILNLKGPSLNWFYSYLKGRHITTSINGKLSAELPVTHGVPQGSILGPILFLLFINDMPNCFSKCTVHLYADDTVVYCADKNPKKIESILNEDLKKLYDWMSCNKLRVNCSKTVCMLIGTKSMLNKHGTLNLRMNENPISQVDNFKYLGVHIDSELKWNLHIDELCKKVSKMISFLGRVGKFINESSLKLLYNAAIMPHFDYGDVIWHSAAQTNLDILQKLQNRAGRIILKVKFSEHKSISEIHDVLKWEMLKNRNKEHEYIMMYKILNDMSPEYLKEKFSFKISTYNLRQNENLALPKPITQNCKRTFLYRGSKLYNDLPKNVRQAGSIALFKKKIKALI